MSTMEGAEHGPSYEQAQPRTRFGKYAGVVLENAKQQGASAHLGQIKVRVPGILEETPDGTSNRALEVIASPSFPPGFFFVPDKDAPVWVEFVAGDINFPIWSGAWYPSGVGAPKTFDGNAPTEKQKIIRTTSGHVIQLDDTDSGSAQKIVVHDEPNKSTVTFDKDGIKIDTQKDNIKISTQKGSVALGPDDITFTHGSTTITIKDQELQLKSGASSITLNAQGIKISSSADVTVNDHGVVLGPLIAWLQTHQHIGNMGAPTPLFPADLAQIVVPPPTMVSKLGGG